jgi:hypothetical protein
MRKLDKALSRMHFRWLPKHLNHIAENIAIKKRNISFLAINALFRQKSFEVAQSPPFYSDSYIIKGKVPLQKNDPLRTIEDELIVIFRLDEDFNIIVITAYSETDEN